MVKPNVQCLISDCKNQFVSTKDVNASTERAKPQCTMCGSRKCESI